MPTTHSSTAGLESPDVLAAELVFPWQPSRQVTEEMMQLASWATGDMSRIGQLLTEGTNSVHDVQSGIDVL